MAPSGPPPELLAALSALDRSELPGLIFHPRRAPGPGRGGQWAFFEVERGVRLGCKFWRAARGCPTLLCFHGNGEIVTDYDEIAPRFLERGINLLVADYRGYGLSEGRPGLVSLLQDAHRLLAEARRWLRDQREHGPLFVMGRSLGSLPALELALAHPEEVRGLVLESASADNFRHALHRLGLSTAGHPWWEEGHGLLPVERIRSLLVPTLIVHARYDSLVPLEDARRLYEACGAPLKRLTIIEGADHNDVMFVDPEGYYGSIQRFIATCSRG